MNAKTRIATLALAAMLFGSNALADHGNNTYARHNRVQYDYAQVISAEPIVNYVTVSAPVRECWEEMEYYTVDNNAGQRGASTLLGAILGGVVGHQIGSGSGNDAATVAGTMIGAAIGNSSARKHQGTAAEQHARPVERCETRYRSHQEERVNGYRVMYRYHGQKYMTEMPYDPGNRIKVRVDIRPAR